VLKREGGGHVTFYERTEGDTYICRGGNESDSVNQRAYAIADVISLKWPKAAGRHRRFGARRRYCESDPT
jgi:hypothetical protein